MSGAVPDISTPLSPIESAAQEIGRPVRTIRWPAEGENPEVLLTREWLVTNGLGGYASGTISGVITRRFHGLLIAALPSPLGRRMMFNDLAEHIRLPDGRLVMLGGEERATHLKLHGAECLREFRIELGLPVWIYRFEDITLEKRIVMVHGQNTVHICYRAVCARCRVRLELRPALHFRPHEGALGGPLQEPYATTVVHDRYEFSCAEPGLPPLRTLVFGEGAAFTCDERYIKEVLYRIEESRGYEFRGDLWSPGCFHFELSEGSQGALVASTEPWDIIRALSPEQAMRLEVERQELLLERAHPPARSGWGAELVLAADQFVIAPAGRAEDMARVHAMGGELRTVIAGYHWFTDWGRDTMISLEGLTLWTGRQAEAGWILRTFAHYIRDGLIPNMFPEGENEGLYHTADASLWYFHALGRYLEMTGDRQTLRALLPQLLEIVLHHLRGTRFNIHVDAADGLLAQGAPGYQLTWMDAKVEDWVVTPRRSKAVEINALWYNALRLLERWVQEESWEQHHASELADHAERARESFNRRFWYEQGGYLYDVVDTESGEDDSACRPNQLFAISLDFPVLEESRWKSVVEVCRDRLLTPVGLRSLSRDHADYKRNYRGDLRTRDAAYHQGTVWGWLIGPFIDAWLKAHRGDKKEARKFLAGFEPHLSEACIGTIAEVFDAEEPFTPRACVAQAWSVAEVLRCWVKTAE